MPDELPPPLERPSRPKDPGAAWFSALLGAAAGGVLIIAALKWLGPLPKTVTAHPWAATAAALLGAALAPLVHELGHVVGGLLAGFRFVWLVWGPLELRREGERLRLARNRHLGLAGGLALCLPPDEASRWGVAWYVGGGPLLSLGAGSAALALAGAGGMPAQGSVEGWAAAAFGLASLGIGLLTLIPSRRGGLLSDGARLLRSLRQPALARQDLAVAVLSGLSLGARRPRDWPAELLAQVALEGEPPDATAAFVLYLHALDHGHIAQARAHLQQALCMAPAVTPLATELALEAAFFEVAVRRDPERGHRWLELARRTLDRPFWQAVQAAASLDYPGLSRAAQRLAARSGVDALRAEKLLKLTA
ncbi:hypothetical protein [Allomeiothermus silvanus]|uniref:hypothetical protein n=1 Tax=Allomeiothermus silvanus TaxID=52022 RepID=UPI0023F3188B|nr:hypothetical protein [Allomeiothermus silvanus]